MSRSSKRGRSSSTSHGSSSFAGTLTRTGGRLPANLGEKKNIDTSVTFPTFGVATGAITLLNGCAQGTTASTRLGRQIRLTSLYLRAAWAMAPTSTGSTPIRVMVVYDKQANATPPAATDVLVTDVLQNVNNLSNSRRFVTLLDHVVPCIGTAGPQSVSLVLYKKLNHMVEFNAGSAGTIGDIQSGSVYALIWNLGTIGVASLVGLVVTRIRFTDL